MQKFVKIIFQSVWGRYFGYSHKWKKLSLLFLRIIAHSFEHNNGNVGYLCRIRRPNRRHFFLHDSQTYSQSICMIMYSLNNAYFGGFVPATGRFSGWTLPRRRCWAYIICDQINNTWEYIFKVLCLHNGYNQSLFTAMNFLIVLKR